MQEIEGLLAVCFDRDVDLRILKEMRAESAYVRKEKGLPARGKEENEGRAVEVMRRRRKKGKAGREPGFGCMCTH